MQKSSVIIRSASEDICEDRAEAKTYEMMSQGWRFINIYKYKNIYSTSIELVFEKD